MSSGLDKAIKDIIQTFREAGKNKPAPFDTQAEVVRVDGDTAWVHIPGGVDETPVKLTINAKVGDKIQVHIGGGRAWITGNATAPPTDDRQANIATEKAETVEKKVSVVQKIADTAMKIAGNTTQYFWHTQEGTDTGAHITEKPQEEFLDDPQNGGGNLLMRSNGLAVRDGLTELATFSGTGMTVNDSDGAQVASLTNTESQIGRDGEQRAIVTPSAFTLVSDDDVELFSVSSSGTPKSQTVTHTVKAKCRPPKRSLVVDLEQTPSSGTTISVLGMVEGGVKDGSGVPVLMQEVTFVAGTSETKTIYRLPTYSNSTTQYGTCAYDGDKRFTFTMTYSQQETMWVGSRIAYTVVTVTDAGALKVAGEHYMNISADTDLKAAIHSFFWDSEVIVDA